MKNIQQKFYLIQLLASHLWLFMFLYSMYHSFPTPRDNTLPKIFMPMWIFGFFSIFWTILNFYFIYRFAKLKQYWYLVSPILNVCFLVFYIVLYYYYAWFEVLWPLLLLIYFVQLIPAIIYFIFGLVNRHFKLELKHR